MIRFRLLLINMGVILFGILIINMFNTNNLFFLDMRQAIIDVQVELLLTAVFVIVLFWLGLELNNYADSRRRAFDNVGDVDDKQATSEFSIRRNTIPSQFWEGISTEMMGAMVTTLFLGGFGVIFQQYQTIQNVRADLIRQMGSIDNVRALDALNQLKKDGFLYVDTTLAGANFNNANLQNADFEDFPLHRVNLANADLRNVTLSGNLVRVNLANANLSGASFQDSALHHINLAGANLSQANLQGISLININLENAIFGNADNRALLDENTRLPDGSQYAPQAGIGQLERFTNSDHPDFWQPNWVEEWKRTGITPAWLTQWDGIFTRTIRGD